MISLLSIFRPWPGSLMCARQPNLSTHMCLSSNGDTTTVDAVQHALRAVPNVSESVLGAVLNKADIKSLATYDPHLTSYYYHKGDQ